MMLYHTIPLPSFYCHHINHFDLKVKLCLGSKQNKNNKTLPQQSQTQTHPLPIIPFVKTLVISPLDYYNSLLTCLLVSGLASGPFYSPCCC